ncbi:MAG: glycoside hydrolase family 13 protein [Bacteroidota bacterium]
MIWRECKRLLTVAILLLYAGCAAPNSQTDATHEAVPAWVQDAVFYQIFPERFRNGDPTNDPVRASLEYVERAPADWAITPWTGDWYAQAPWEQTMGGFYESVFHRRYGGDLQGVIDGLDYLADLGITALYFNPVFYARSLHKYDGNSFHHIDPYFGPDPEGDLALIADETADPETWQWTAADRLFLDLLTEARARGIRVVIDGVWNHTGRDFFAFADLRERQADSPYADWYVVEQFDDPATPASEFAYEGWWGVETLPVFADTPDGQDLHPEPKQYIFDATARWMDPNGDGDPSDGIDGWRLDVAEEVPTGFWADWNAHVRRLNPDAYTVAEVWAPAQHFLDEGGFSATMNYHAFALPVKAFLIDEQVTAERFADLLDEGREAYGTARQTALLNLVDSHDTDRVASMIVNAKASYRDPEWFDYDRDVSPRNAEHYDYAVRAPDDAERAVQRMVALMQFAYPGAPMLYYGTEAGMWGADDPDDRKPMVWADLDYADEAADPRGRSRTPDPVAFDAELFAFFQQLIGLRAEHAALRSAELAWLEIEGAEQTVGFTRGTGEAAITVLLNRSDSPQAIKLPASVGETVLLTTNLPFTPQRIGQTLHLTVPPLTGALLKP